jgi:hypothetical protein
LVGPPEALQSLLEQDFFIEFYVFLIEVDVEVSIKEGGCAVNEHDVVVNEGGGI